MQNLVNSKLKDEIDFIELFFILWAHKLFIACTFALGILCAIYSVLNIDKKYTSTAIFKLIDDNKNNQIEGNLNSLIDLSLLGRGNFSTILPIDKVTGRVFIENLDTKLNFRSDPYFNTYNPNPVDPFWKSLIKRTIGWQKDTTDTEEAIWQNILTSYANNITLDKTPDMSFKIKVNHTNALRAAEFANVIMDEIIKSAINQKSKEQNQYIIYMSNVLAESLSDLELSQYNLKEFTLKNSALPLKDFAAGSLKLDGLREQLTRTSELLDAIAALSLILQNEVTDQNSYLALRKQFPIVDQVEFRRVLGQNEIIGSWSWPDADSVVVVFDTLLERKNRLLSEINASQDYAERSSQAVKTYSKLQREAKIAEATYTMLIEQVKTQSMTAGFKPQQYEIYEYASAATYPSSPNRKLIIILGAALGLIVGATISLWFGLSRGVFYSKNTLITKIQAPITASIKTLKPFRNKSLDNISTILEKKPNSVLRYMTVGIYKNSAIHVVLTSSSTKLTGNDVARTLACYMKSDAMKFAIIDFSSRGKKLNIDHKKLSFGSFVVTESSKHISVLKPNNDLPAMELLKNRDFCENIDFLKSTFDIVFLSADNSDAISLLSALEGQDTFHITLARTKKTKSSTLMQMHSLHPIQGMLYD
ncbi:Wzz/FepE/Etk N-terminal domain-containing protein [Amylibacter sp.]|nr:Wzz/FepE/Etk N-terminal domain-containing protein [Amylibacter sp.]